MSLKVDTKDLKNVVAAAAKASKEQSRALISVGYQLKQKIKEGMKAQAPGGEAWPQPHPWTAMGSLRNRYVRRSAKWGRTSMSWTERRKSGKAFQSRTGKKPLAKLAGAVRYQKFIEGGTGGGVADTRVMIGFLTPRVAKLALYHAGGPHTRTVTGRMRRLLYAAGLGIRSSNIKIPTRRHVEPVYEKTRSSIAAYVQARVAAVLSGGGGVSNL